MELLRSRGNIRRLTVQLRKLASTHLNRLIHTRRMAVLPIANRIRRNILSNPMLLKRAVMRWLFQVGPFCGSALIRG